MNILSSRRRTTARVGTYDTMIRSKTVVGMCRDFLDGFAQKPNFSISCSTTADFAGQWET